MKYMGGKSKIAKEIVPIIQRHIEARGTGKYIEPFVGGANIIDKVECESRVGLDINRYLIALFNHIKRRRIAADHHTGGIFQGARGAGSISGLVCWVCGFPCKLQRAVF